MKLGTKLSELVPYKGDRSIVLEWSNFSNPFCFVMKRALHRNFPNDDFWLEGLSHLTLDQVLVEDLRDLKHVGEKRFRSTLQELADMFAILDEELEREEISLEVLSQSSSYEDSVNQLLEEELQVDPIDTATNVEELRLAIINYFDLYRPIDERSREILLARHFAFGNQDVTLEQLGERFGITRERVRQIATKYEDLVLSSPRESNDLLERVLKLANEAKNHVEFALLMTDNSLTTQEDFSIVNAVALCEVLQMADMADAFLSVYELWEQHYEELDEQTKAVNRYRSKIGLIDIDFMSREMLLNRDDCKAIILRAYPRSIFTTKYALARTERLDTTFENVLYKQLLVCEEVNLEDLVEGIRRHSVYRKAELPGENTDFVGLVEQLTGNPPELSTLQSNTLESAELSDTDQWLIGCFNNRKNRMLHRSELVQLAFESGRNTATIGVYTLFNPLLRNCGQSVYTILGTKVADEEVRIYAEMVRKNFPETEMSYELEMDTIVLSVLPNINALGGVIFPPKELYKMVEGSTFVPTCICERLNSKQKIQFSVSNFWMGFSSIFKHAIDAHAWDLKNPVSIVLDFNSNKACLRSDLM